MSTIKHGSPMPADILHFAPKMELFPTFQGSPSFPTLNQLALELPTPEQKPSLGLFESLLNNPAILYEDFLKDPTKYDPALEKLLMELATGNKQVRTLLPADRMLLDVATLEYAQAPRPKPPAKPAAQAPTTDDDVVEEWTSTKEQKPRPGIDVPVTELPAYWWL